MGAFRSKSSKWLLISSSQAVNSEPSGGIFPAGTVSLIFSSCFRRALAAWRAQPLISSSGLSGLKIFAVISHLHYDPGGRKLGTRQYPSRRDQARETTRGPSPRTKKLPTSGSLKWRRRESNPGRLDARVARADRSACVVPRRFRGA